MLDESYLIRGLNALSRAHERDFFGDGHRGAALVAAYYFCHERALPSATQSVIADCLRHDLDRNDLFAPLPAQAATPELASKIVETLAVRIGSFKMAGHSVIFPSAALKAFREVPHAATPRRVEGICKLIKCFDSVKTDESAEIENIPGFDDEAEMVRFIFHEFLGALPRWKGYGQGWAGHLLTFSHALIELSDLGYGNLTKAGHPALRSLISITRRGPREGDRPIPDHLPSPWTPLDAQYWKGKRPGLNNLGHVFKYPYSYYNLLARLKDQELRGICEAQSYQIF